MFKQTTMGNDKKTNTLNLGDIQDSFLDDVQIVNNDEMSKLWGGRKRMTKFNPCGSILPQ